MYFFNVFHLVKNLKFSMCIYKNKIKSGKLKSRN